MVAELQQRSARIQNLEAQLIAARRTPAALAALTERVEARVRANVADLRQALVEQADLREVFHAMFPDGLTFEPARTPDGGRQIWKISGYADFASVAEGDLVRLESDPNGIRRIRNRARVHPPGIPCVIATSIGERPLAQPVERPVKFLKTKSTFIQPALAHDSTFRSRRKSLPGRAGSVDDPPSLSPCAAERQLGEGSNHRHDLHVYLLGS